MRKGLGEQTAMMRKRRGAERGGEEEGGRTRCKRTDTIVHFVML